MNKKTEAEMQQEIKVELLRLNATIAVDEDANLTERADRLTLIDETCTDTLSIRWGIPKEFAYDAIVDYQRKVFDEYQKQENAKFATDEYCTMNPEFPFISENDGSNRRQIVMFEKYQAESTGGGFVAYFREEGRLQIALSRSEDDSKLPDPGDLVDVVFYDRETGEQLFKDDANAGFRLTLEEAERHIEAIMARYALEQPSELERRMHQALKDSWKYIDRSMVSNTARNEVGPLVNAESIAGRRVEMLFALQTAWTFVHGSGDKVLIAELGDLLRHDVEEKPQPPKNDGPSFEM